LSRSRRASGRTTGAAAPLYLAIAGREAPGDRIDGREPAAP